MKKATRIWVLLLVAVLVPAICLAQADKIFSQHSKAVIVVMTYDGTGKPMSQGSGFIVRQDGVFVTNYHVISEAANIKIKVGNKVFNVHEVIDLDKEGDIAILKVNAKNLPIVILGDLEKTRIGEKIYVISSPKGLENTISDGILSGKREAEDDKQILQITAPISPGSSGGPVFNQNGQVIGIATFLLKESQNLNFAMPVDGIKDKIRTKQVGAIKQRQIENYSKTSEYWLNLGYAYGMSGKDRESVEAFKQAIQINPGFAEAHYNLGTSYYKLGRYQEAIESYKQVIRLKPGAVIAHHNLGTSYYKLGRYQEAIESYKQAIQIKPDLALAHFGVASAYGMLGKQQEAIESYKQVIQIKPDYAEAYFSLGSAYERLGRHQEAIESFKQAIQIKSDYAEAYYGVGYAYGMLGKDWEAIKAFKQAIQINPGFALAHYSLGMGYLNLKDRNGALSEYEILKNLDPQRAKQLFDFIYK